MASAALTRYNEWVDQLAVGPAVKTALKTRAKQLYAAVVREGIQHFRHHAQAVLNDADAPALAKERATAAMDVTDAIIARDETDAWWLTAVGER